MTDINWFLKGEQKELKQNEIKQINRNQKQNEWLVNYSLKVLYFIRFADSLDVFFCLLVFLSFIIRVK